MILQALTRYYDLLAEDPSSGIAPFGYSTTYVSYALVLSPHGELVGLLPLFETVAVKKKTEERPLPMIVPDHFKRSGKNPPPYFLCDNCANVLGLAAPDAEDNGKSLARFNAFQKFNLDLLAAADCPEARAVAAFLEHYNPQQAAQHPLLADQLERISAGRDLVFKMDQSSGYVHEHPAIKKIWEDYLAAQQTGEQAQCLITGQTTAIARLHPNFKGIRNAPSMGASLVGFNAPAYESYHREQGKNAPTGEIAAFKYGAALNSLLSRGSENPKFFLGDATVVYWAESANKTYTDLFSLLMDPGGLDAQSTLTRRDPLAAKRLREVAEKIKLGAPLEVSGLLEGLDPNTRFYVLGLSPNAARISVRFFHRDLFKKLIERIMSHYQDLQIQREFETQPVYLPLWMILDETVSKKSRDKEASPLMAGAVLRAIFEGGPYPAALYYAILNRIRADADDPARRISKINYVRAAVIKAYLTRKIRRQPNPLLQEVLCMSLNEQSTHPAYLMGRLFAVLEKAQEEAIPNINATIKDRFFSSACASPVTVFPRLLRLSQHHLSKLNPGRKVNLEKITQQIMNLLEGGASPFPAHLSIDDQGAFVLGYYHQRAALFTSTKKDEPNPQPVLAETETH
jgi:CRISPR-associated protein Csd1